jgi:hypothetical protein
MVQVRGYDKGCSLESVECPEVQTLERQVVTRFRPGTRIDPSRYNPPCNSRCWALNTFTVVDDSGAVGSAKLCGAFARLQETALR